MLELLNMKLLEEIREELGGVYSIYASPSLMKYPAEEYGIYIQYTCNPARENEIIKAVDQVMKSIQNSPASAEELKKIKEMQLKELEKESKDNNFWLNALKGSLQYDYPFLTIEQRKARINKLTVKDIQTAAKTYLNTTNYGKFILNPEK